MSIKNRETLKTYFETGDKPTESQFSDLLDSLYNKFDEPDLGGGGDSVTYTNTNPTPSSIGGIPSGSTFEDKTMTQMWDMLLYPYQTPSFLTFSIQSQSSPIEVGDSILSNRTFTWSTSNSSNINPNSLVIRNMTGSVDLATGLSNDGVETVTMGAITKTTQSSNVFRITGTNTNSQNFYLEYTVNWYWAKYYGENVLITLNESDIEGLRVKILSNSFAGSYVFNSGGYKYICYPSSLGTATSFKDSSTNLDVPFETMYTVNVTNSFSQSTNYNVHRTTNIIGSSITIIVN